VGWGGGPQKRGRRGFDTTPRPRAGPARRGAPNRGQSQKEEEMTVNPVLAWSAVSFSAGR
ncbi:MAG: hypothetical protein ACUVXJ_06715, partial [Phycisphaerae bacterium]